MRKVLGSSSREIVFLMLRDFAVLIGVATVIAWPLAWMISREWLSNFAYRIELELGVFLLGGVLALVVAMATISTQAIRAANANPADALRSE